MSVNWRQGDLIAPGDAIELGLVSASEAATSRFLLISHSCDIAADPEVETHVEVLRGELVPAADANYQNGHSIRRLNLSTVTDGGVEWALYLIAARVTIDKQSLFTHEPWPARIHAKSQRDLLRRWLAQRYARSDFPDAFIDWLKSSGVDSRFETLGKRYSAHLVGIYFDLDDDAERVDPALPYELGVNLVYASSVDGAAEQSEKCRQAIETMFRTRCLFSGEWRWIELLYCDVYSDQVFSLSALNSFRRWRFEHRSLGGEPIDLAE